MIFSPSTAEWETYTQLLERPLPLYIGCAKLSLSKMFQNNVYDYSPASQDEQDSAYGKEDSAPSPQPRRWSLKVIFANVLLALISIILLSFAVYQMLRPSSSALLSPDSFFPPCECPIYGI